MTTGLPCRVSAHPYGSSARLAAHSAAQRRRRTVADEAESVGGVALLIHEVALQVELFGHKVANRVNEPVVCVLEKWAAPQQLHPMQLVAAQVYDALPHCAVERVTGLR